MPILLRRLHIHRIVPTQALPHLGADDGISLVLIIYDNGLRLVHMSGGYDLHQRHTGSEILTLHALGRVMVMPQRFIRTNLLEPLPWCPFCAPGFLPLFPLRLVSLLGFE